jgi:anti-sigma factor RsiW
MTQEKLPEKLRMVANDFDTEHGFTREHLPWYANGSLDELARHRVAEHLPHCARCRAEAESELDVIAALGEDGTVDFAPQAGLNDVMQRIERRERRHERFAWLRDLFSGERGQRPLVLAVGIQALVIVMLTGALTLVLRRPAAPVYRTLTSASSQLGVPVGAGAALRVVFVDELTLGDLQALLAPLRLRIVGGPAERGIYTLATDGTVDGGADAALAALRGDSRVRLAEIVTVP